MLVLEEAQADDGNQMSDRIDSVLLEVDLLFYHGDMISSNHQPDSMPEG